MAGMEAGSADSGRCVALESASAVASAGTAPGWRSVSSATWASYCAPVATASSNGQQQQLWAITISKNSSSSTSSRVSQHS